MKILITGVNGFIGNHLKKHFTDKHEIFTISRNKSNLESKNEIVIDLSNFQNIKENFNKSVFEKQIDVIIHCAAVLSGINDNKDISVFHENNAITESMIHIANVLNVSKFINISTIGVYPNKTGIYNENSAIEPSINHECLYSLSKICSEELFKFYLKDKLQIINIRLGQVYGEGMRQDRTFSIMKEELTTKNTITVFGNGERVSNFVSIDYLMTKINEILDHNKIEGTYNLGEKNLSYTELAEMLIKESGNSSSKIILIEKGVNAKVNIDSLKIETILNSKN